MNRIKLITGGTIGLTFLLNVGITFAADSCEVASSCEELGYTETSCTLGVSSIKCPFDSSKMYCDKIGSGIVGDYCYQNDIITGVITNIPNLCINLIEDTVIGNWSWAMGYDAEDAGTSCAVSTTSIFYPCGECYGNNDCTEETSSSPCSSLGSGWRLPTIDEWQLIVTDTSDYTALNNRLSGANGTTLVPSSNNNIHYFWASTEQSKTGVYGFQPGSSSGGSVLTYDPNKHYNNRRVRCVRGF
ncbi:MAG: hypothetical protein R3Y43_00400 [Alphaproteobacteria bacterium]